MARIPGYGGNVYIGDVVVEDCEDIWDEFSDGDVTPTADTTDYKVGSASAKFVMAAPLAVGDILGSEVIAPGTLAAQQVLFCWSKCSVGTTALDDFRIQIDNHAMSVSPEVECSLPILGINIWKFCFCPVVTGAFTAATLPISVSLELIANDPGAGTIWLDHILAGRQIVGIRAWSLDVVANVQDTSAYSDGQDKVFMVTQKEWSGSFDGFKDGPPLAIGNHVAIELMEAEVALPGPSTAAWRGQVVITNVRPASSVDGIVTYAYDFQGIHALEWPTT